MKRLRRKWLGGGVASCDSQIIDLDRVGLYRQGTNECQEYKIKEVPPPSGCFYEP